MCSKGTAVQRVWANSWVGDVRYPQALHFEAAVIAGLVSTNIGEHSPERLLLVALRGKKWGILIESANALAESTIPVSTNARQQKLEKGARNQDLYARPFASFETLARRSTLPGYELR